MRGTMRERRPGHWELRVYVGRDPVTNAPRQVSRSFQGGKRAAQSALAGLVAEAEQGKLGGTDATMTLLLARHLEALERNGTSPTTLHAYRRYVRLHIEPAIGKTAVRKLTAWDLDRLYAGMIDGGKGPATVRQTHAIISGALKQAVKWGWVPTNVAKMASPPTVRPAKVRPPSAAEVRRLLDAAGESDPVMAALIMLAALTGARRGELCALRWTDVDLVAGTVRIARSVIDLPDRVEEKTTKTHAERTIALGEPGVALLRLHRQGVDSRAETGEVTVAADAFVFSERLDCATPIRPDRVTGFVTWLRNELDLPHVHLHSLRHFMATQLASRGDVSVRTLAGRLGHADASVTLRVYSHFFPAADADAAEYLGRILSPPALTEPSGV